MSHGSLDQLIADFQSCKLPREAWTHGAHLRVGAWHVDRLGAENALVTLRAGIRRLNDSHGTVNSPVSGYHETITAAYVQLIEAFLRTFEAGVPFDERLAALVESPLGDRSILLRYWSRERLMSPEARGAWLAPDLEPLVLPA
ncbi:MAG TPA: hypothetical protein VLA79_03360 [Polyangia bacterium]|nr:hypothetical protein [Polyangia bacterium]